MRELLYKIAKGPFMGKIAGTAFRYCSWAIPVKKVYNSREIIGFCHPKPSYENHLILSPKRAVKNLRQLASEPFCGYFMKVWEAVKEICAACPPYHDLFAVVANGGKRQEVQQVHFHMFTNHKIVNEYSEQGQDENIFYRDENLCVLEHPDPNWEIHFVIKAASPSAAAGEGEDKHMYFSGVLHSIDRLNARFGIVQKGYSLVYQRNRPENEKKLPVFHIVSGKKLK